MNKAAAAIIGNAIVWGMVIIGCSLALKGTGEYAKIQNILAGGTFASSFIVLVSLRKLGKATANKPD